MILFSSLQGEERGCTWVCRAYSRYGGSYPGGSGENSEAAYPADNEAAEVEHVPGYRPEANRLKMVKPASGRAVQWANVQGRREPQSSLRAMTDQMVIRGTGSFMR